MRILMLSAAYPPGEGGVATHVATLAHSLSRRGVDIVVLTTGKDETEQEKAKEDGKLKPRPEGYDHLRILKRPKSTVPAYDGRRVFGEGVLQFIVNKWHRIEADIVHWGVPTS